MGFKRRGGRGRGRGYGRSKNNNRNGYNQDNLHRPSSYTIGKVVVTNLKNHVSSDDIKEIFEKFGTVTQAFVKFNAKSGASTGIAEVYYSRGIEARQAQKELDGAKIDNGVIRVRLDTPSNNKSKRGGFNAKFSGRGRGRSRGRGRGRGNHPLSRY